VTWSGLVWSSENALLQLCNYFLVARFFFKHVLHRFPGFFLLRAPWGSSSMHGHGRNVECCVYVYVFFFVGVWWSVDHQRGRFSHRLCNCHEVSRRSISFSKIFCRLGKIELRRRKGSVMSGVSLREREGRGGRGVMLSFGCGDLLKAG
jgi:hypothetical protein